MGAASARQLALYISELRNAATLKDFFSWHDQNYRGDPEKIDAIFKFLRAAEYSLPEYFAAVERMVNLAGRTASYGLFLAQMPRWFRADALKMLEEQGVPIQISEQFIRASDTVKTLSDRLVVVARASDPRMSLSSGNGSLRRCLT